MSATRHHENYRTFGTYASFAEAEVELRDYWRSRTPLQRLEALEELRARIYGEEAIKGKVATIFGPCGPLSKS
jgi:predicted metal-dependent hydrolase